MTVQLPGTFYVPEGESRTVSIVKSGDQPLFTDDNGTLVAFCYVEEAESDGILLLKQYNAGSLIGEMRAMAEYGAWNPEEEALVITRDSYSRFEVDVKSLDLGDAA